MSRRDRLLALDLGPGASDVERVCDELGQVRAELAVALLVGDMRDALESEDLHGPPVGQDGDKRADHW